VTEQEIEKKKCNKCLQEKPLQDFTYGRALCKICHNKKRNLLSKSIKERLVKELGGACYICGYNKCFEALEFHHKDPAEKDKKISDFSSYEKAVEEAKKCILVCANCHREIHLGVIKIEQ
jgi:predicted HNH restriction endonuclease